MITVRIIVRVGEQSIKAREETGLIIERREARSITVSKGEPSITV